MEWEELQRHQRRYFSAKTSATEESLEKKDAEELWKKLFCVVLSNEIEDRWDSIRVECSLETGRLITFVEKKGIQERVENGGCDMCFESKLSAWEKLADSDLDDIDFEKREEQIRDLMVENSIEAFEKVKTGLHGIEKFQKRGVDLNFYMPEESIPFKVHSIRL